MIRAVLAGCLLAALSPLSNAQVFRCDADTGVVFSDQPCGTNPEPVDIRDNRVGGRLDQNLPPETGVDSEHQPSSPSPAPEAASTCRFINSTDLRRYIVREQVVRGMTRDHVRRAFGEPPETHASPQEVWIYQSRYYGALYELTYVYFRDGCVESVEYRKP